MGLRGPALQDWKFKIGYWILFPLLFPFSSSAQNLPEPVTNQALAGLLRNGQPVIYSFFGLDSTKQQPGVHKKVFRIELTTGKSAKIGEVPDEVGRLAPAASVIKNKAYLVGGYAVHPGGKEKSSTHLFDFDPATEEFTSGARLLVPVDDQMQGVWRDSLLFVISGWYDSLTIRTVQVYNPITNQWKLATPLPDDKKAAVFGGCAMIAGDTIYVLGGAMFQIFYPPSRNFYKGYINPRNPREITWKMSREYPGPYRYRSDRPQVRRIFADAHLCGAWRR